MKKALGVSNAAGERANALMRAAAVIALAFALVVSASMLGGCSSGPEGSEGSAPASSGEGADAAPVRIGTMPTEDFLPMWAAEKDGFFADAGVDAELLSFDSAQALSAAIAAGEVDMAMVDVPRAVKLCESGTPVVMEWITLGAEASQGAFGVLASADAPYSTLPEMAAYLASGEGDFGKEGVGLASNTVPEYVFDMLCEQANVDPATVPQQEVASLPERFSLAATGKLAAAALPASMLRLGEANGMKLLAEDTDGDNISQSVMIATASFAEENPEAVKKVAEAWNAAAEAIDADPEAYSVLLAEKANLNEAIADTYPVAEYPMAIENGAFLHPAADLVDPQLAWMRAKEYSTHDVTYDEATGAIKVD